MNDIGHPFEEIGIAGYPEGHPVISDERLRQALGAKAELATYVVTQMCFSAGPIVEWARATSRDGVLLPIRVGVPGAVDAIRLLSVSRAIGVGESLRFLSKNRGLLRVLRPRFSATRLISDLAREGEGLGFDGLHLFTFNQVAALLSVSRAITLARQGR